VNPSAATVSGPQSPTPSASFRADPGKWGICLLLLFATVLNYLDRQVLSLNAEYVMREFGLDKEGFGRLVAMFRYFYAAVQIGGGWLADCLGPRGLFPAAVGLWSAAGMMSGLAPGLWSMMVSRGVLGIGEAFNWPCALKTTERLIDRAERPIANGIFNSGSALGALIAPFLVTYITLRLGWRASFLFVGALGAIWIVIWLRATRKYADRLRGVPAGVGHAARIVALELARPHFWQLMVAAIFINGINYTLADWVPLYLKTERGFGFAAGNLLSTLVYAGIDAGNLSIGFFIRFLIGRGLDIDAARRRGLLVSCILLSSAVMVGIVESRFVALAALALTGFGLGSFLVIYLSRCQELNPAHLGAVTGVLGGLGNLVYGFLSPYIGALADSGNSAVTFTFMGTLPWLAFAAMSWRPKQERASSSE
jgi:ACS family hexuronate transporter-like MFS transporter